MISAFLQAGTPVEFRTISWACRRIVPIETPFRRLVAA